MRESGSGNKSGDFDEHSSGVGGGSNDEVGEGKANGD